MSSPRQSGGILMYRRVGSSLEVFLVHPGGPFFRHRDNGHWSLPKGEFEEGEGALETARREFGEETGQSVEACGARGRFLELGSVVQRGGKRVHAWAFEGDWPEGAELDSNTFQLEWPPRSGRFQEIVEVDRAEFFSVEEARRRINPAQAEFFDRLLDLLVTGER